MNASALSTSSVPPRLVHFPLNRNIVIATGVVVFHVAVLWGLQNGLLRRAVEVVVPIKILSQIITPPAPSVAPPSPVPPAPLRQPVPRRSEPRPLPASLPAAIADPTPTPNAPTAVLAPQPATPPVAAPVPAAAAPPAAPAPSRIEPPSSNADYLQNPKPAYPPISKRLGEQGKVMLRVLIGADGAAKEAEISQSSGFERLDKAALSTVLKWRYLPGKRGGVPEAMWFNVPINFVLE